MRWYREWHQRYVADSGRIQALQDKWVVLQEGKDEPLYVSEDRVEVADFVDYYERQHEGGGRLSLIVQRVEGATQKGDTKCESGEWARFFAATWEWIVNKLTF